MKDFLQKNALVLFCFSVLILYLVSLYFYPTTRDEFFYLSKKDNIFIEYYHSYLQVNARIGQFFSNLSGRNLFFKVLISCFIFVSFFYLFFALIFRKRLFFKNTGDLKKLVIVSGIFIFLINYFGEMFFYIPYSTNYTLLNVFYMLYISIIINYYIYGNNLLLKYKIPVWIIVILGFFTGMGNEHVPPALLCLTGIYVVYEIIKKKKFVLPAKRILIMAASICFGYVVLFIAPANRVRFQREGKAEYGFNISDYMENFVSIAKIYYYYNFELLLFLGIIAIYSIYFRKLFTHKMIIEVASYLFLAVLGILITAYSPIVGTRLLFFSNVLLIISALMLFFRNNRNFFTNCKRVNITLILCASFILVYFTSSVVISYNAHQNYKVVIAEIISKSKNSNNITIRKTFNYQTDFFGIFNRKVLLDTGESYIDKDVDSNTNVEKNILEFYNIKTIKTEK